MKRLLIGLGAERSGTASLARILDGQRHASVSLERKLQKWDATAAEIKTGIRKILFGDVQFLGDVCITWLSAVERIAMMAPDSRFICIKRPKDDSVEDFLTQTEKAVGAKERRDNLIEVPEFNLPLRKGAAPRKTFENWWTDYYLEADRLQAALSGRFGIWDIDAFDGENGIRDILRFAGFGGSRMIADVGGLKQRDNIGEVASAIIHGVAELHPPEKPGGKEQNGGAFSEGGDMAPAEP